MTRAYLLVFMTVSLIQLECSGQVLQSDLMDSSDFSNESILEGFVSPFQFNVYSRFKTSWKPLIDFSWEPKIPVLFLALCYQIWRPDGP